MVRLSKKESRKAIKQSSNEEGMERFMDRVGEEDLDESGKAQLSLNEDEEHAEEEEDDEEENEDDDGDEEDDDEEIGGELGTHGTEGESVLGEDADDVRDVRFSRRAVTHWDNLC